MSTEGHELHRIISASVGDMLDAYRLQAQAGPVSEQALEGIVFPAAHPIVNSLAPYPTKQRAALLPNVVRLLLAAFLEDVAGADGARPERCATKTPWPRAGRRETADENRRRKDSHDHDPAPRRHPHRGARP